MSLEDFQILDSEPFGDSIIKRDCLIIYHQQGASLSDSNQNVVFIFVENNIYHQLANGYLEFDIIVQDTAGNFTNASVLRLTSNAFAHCFKEAVLSTTGGSDLEHIKVVGAVSAIMRLSTSKDSDLFSCFDENYENALDNNIFLEQLLIINHTDANKGKIKGHLPLERIFGFCKTIKRITKNLAFYLTVKTKIFKIL